jgi:hypothetical protein
MLQAARLILNVCCKVASVLRKDLQFVLQAKRHLVYSALSTCAQVSLERTSFSGSLLNNAAGSEAGAQ